MSRLPDASLVIGIAASPTHRAQLARILGGSDAVLIVSSTEQARAFLGLAAVPGEPPRVAVPAEAPADELPGDLALDPDRRVLRWMGREVALTRLEHEFLTCLASERGQIWTYQRLHRAVWGNDHLGRGSDVHSVVRRLRRKLARLGSTVTIDAVRGVGLRLSPVEA